MSVNGTQLSTYNPNLPITTSTTAGTSGLIVYPQSADGANGGITNAPTTGTYYDGITHFKNVCGINSINLGVSGAEIPLTDKQGIETYTSGSVSAGTSVICVAPYQCTVAAYWTQITTPPAALPVTTITNTAGTILLTYTPTATGSAYDTYAMALGTAGSVTVNAGQVLLFNLAAAGTAFNQIITLVMTRVGI